MEKKCASWVRSHLNGLTMEPMGDALGIGSHGEGSPRDTWEQCPQEQQEGVASPAVLEGRDGGGSRVSWYQPKQQRNVIQISLGKCGAELGWTQEKQQHILYGMG